MSANAARKIDLPSAEEMAESPGFKAAEAFAQSRALEILREWVDTPEIRAIMEEAERIKAADAARG